jgi:hypothetical protein
LGPGFGVRSQKGGFILLMAVALIILTYAAFRVFSA